MAYNVLKGTVEGSVDQHANQEIGGVKIFKNTISASVFYDTDAQSPCATLRDVPIRKLLGTSPTTLLTYQGSATMRAEHNLTFDGTDLTTKNIRAQALYGSACGLTDIPTTRFSGSIAASNLELGSTLRSVRGKLQVKPSKGVAVTRDGLSLALDPQGALEFRNNQLSVEPKRCPDISARGQNLSDDDLLIVHDASRGDTRRTTLGNFYDSYINAKSIQPEGPVNSLQLRGRKGLNASAALTFDVKAKILNLDGEAVVDALRVTGDTISQGDTKHGGAVFNNISIIADKKYEVRSQDHTLLADTSETKVTIMLPPACECVGRVLIIKKINSNKYKLASHPLEIGVEEGAIDFRETLTIKHNYSIRAVQSDGTNWWVINKTGS